MLRDRATTTTLLLAALTALLLACGGGAKGPPRAPAAPTDPPGLERVRAAYAGFVGSAMGSADYDALAGVHAAEREPLPPAPQAEADLLLAFAGVRLVESSLDKLGELENPAHDLMTATVLPLTWQTRPLDGESGAAFRDRLCQGPGASVCAGALPDFWGAALVFEAAKQLAERVRTLAGACACGKRYGGELERAQKVADAARVRDSDQRPGWGLEMDNLARSAFATPEWPPGDVRVRVRPAELLPGKRKAIAAQLAARRGAAAKPAENGVQLLEIEALGDTSVADLGQIVAAARDAGFAAMLLNVRLAAPPNPRGFLKVELATARAPKGATALVPPGKAKKDGMQALVDQIDAAYGTSEAARVVWVVK